MSFASEKTVVVGVGLLGGSLGAGLRERGLARRVVGVGRSHKNLEEALRAGCIDQAEYELAPALDGADLVVLAVPVDTAVAMLPEVLRAAPSDADITDVGSVKAPICAAARAAGAGGRFLGAHPMAGGTATGAAEARSDLFEGAVVVLTPTAATEPDTLASARAMWSALGAETVDVDAEVHDHAVASASHLPQLVSVCTALAAARAGEPEWISKLAAGGFASVTRLASSDPAMWTAIADLNREEIAAAMDRFAELWQALAAAVATGDREALTALFQEARRFKETVDK